MEGLENQKEFVLGSFYRCSAPPTGLIQSVLSRLWSKRCRIYTRQLSDTTFLFHIPDEPTRKWVTQRGLWHVDDCIMFVSPWNPSGTISLPEITTIPVWLTLKDIPHQLYSKKGISWIASGIGAPMLTSRPWLDPVLMGEAKILVEVKLDKPFPQRVALEDESGEVSMVTVIYSWLPTKCPKCGQLGHKAPRCLGLPAVPTPKAPKHDDVQIALHTKNVESYVSDQKISNGAISSDVISFDDQGCILLEQESSHPTLNKDDEAPCVASATIVISHEEGTLSKEEAPLAAPATVDISSEESPLNREEAPSAILDTTDNGPKEGTHSNTTIIMDKEDDVTVEETIAITSQLSDVLESNENVSTQLLAEEEAIEENGSSVDHRVNIDDNCSNTDLKDFSTPSSSKISDYTEALMCTKEDKSTENKGVHTSYFALYEATQRSRGGRPLKPSQKLQEMEWITVRGRGKRGRGGTPGRGSSSQQ